jgi:hypothetical protein
MGKKKKGRNSHQQQQHHQQVVRVTTDVNGVPVSEMTAATKLPDGDDDAESDWIVVDFAVH